jgi:hypothetical protein
MTTQTAIKASDLQIGEELYIKMDWNRGARFFKVEQVSEKAVKVRSVDGKRFGWLPLSGLELELDAFGKPMPTSRKYLLPKAWFLNKMSEDQEKLLLAC